MCLPSDTPTMKYLKIFTVITISIEYNTFNSNPTCIRLYSATLTGWRSTCHLMPRLWISLDLKTSLSQMVEQVRVRGHSISSCSRYSAGDGCCWILMKHWVGSPGSRQGLTTFGLSSSVMAGCCQVILIVISISDKCPFKESNISASLQHIVKNWK